MRLVDTHCHLDFNQFNADREAVLARAWEAGVERILIPGIDLDSSQAAVALAEAHPQVYAAVGVHPNSARLWEAGSLTRLRSLAASPKVVAIGEIGLDAYRERAPMPLQIQVLRAQLALAAELGLPVVVHNRQASADLLPILAEWRAGLVETGSALAERPGVLHSFSEGEPVARQAIALGFFIGFTGPVTFRNGRDLQALAASLPLEHVLVETDAPFLTPHPRRGQRNEPAYVRLVAEKIAELHNQAFAAVANLTTTNAARLFHW